MKSASHCNSSQVHRCHTFGLILFPRSNFDGSNVIAATTNSSPNVQHDLIEIQGPDLGLLGSGRKSLNQMASGEDGILHPLVASSKASEGA